MILAVSSIIGGFIFLAWSADKFIEGAASVSFHAGLSPLLIGMVILGFGTSAPEIIISAITALEGKSDIALGNALGSNIFNSSLILGLAALVNPIKVSSRIIRRELPLCLGITLMLGVLLWDYAISLGDSLILLITFIALMSWTIISAQKSQNEQGSKSFDTEINKQIMGMKLGLFFLLIGLVIMISSSRIIVWGSVYVARFLGLSDLIIGLTVVALGTSLPELAASIAATQKGEDDIAVGNVLGSNMFNILAVIGIAGTIHPMKQIPSEVLNRDYPVALGMIVCLFLMARGFKRRGIITRLEGAALVLSCLAYLSYIIYFLV